MPNRDFGWLSIFRLGLVQTALGGIVVLTTSTLNRVMAVELALPAMIPGALVTLHHAMQALRPRMGYGSDLGQRRTPWIIGGMAALALGALGAAAATAWMATSLALGMGLAVASFALIGAGVSAAGTSLLVLLAKRVAPTRRAAAATLVWIMMIAGFAVTATVAGKLLDPFSPERLITVAAAVSLVAFIVALVAVWGVEGKVATPADDARAGRAAFATALKQVWAEPDARRFTVFVFVSMLAYSAQDLILEPFAGAVFGYTPGESTALAGTQHGGTFTGMLLVALVTTLFKGTRLASLKAWVVGGCLASAVALAGLTLGGLLELATWPLKANVFFLGLANGAFSIAAIGSMMAMASRGRDAREGVRMGLWGAAQAIAFAAGGFLGTLLADVARALGGAPSFAYAFVFAVEALAFLAAQAVAMRIVFDLPAASAEPVAAAKRMPVRASPQGSAA